MSYQYVETLSDDAAKRYEQKLNVVGLRECPYRSPADQWLHIPKQWPEIQYHDVYHYLINFPG